MPSVSHMVSFETIFPISFSLTPNLLYLANMLRHLVGEHKPHLTIPEKDLWNGDFKFTPNRHSVHYLAQIVKAGSRRRGNRMSALQRTAWKRLNSDDKYSGPVPGVSNSDIIEAYFDLFDDLFFFGSIRAHCSLVFSTSTTSGAYGSCSQKAYVGPLFWKWGQYKTKITIYARKRADGLSRRKSVVAYVTVLLHEMLHAFLELWGCGTCRDRHGNVGLGGHGPAWQEVACALTAALEDRRFLDFGVVDMSREVSWAAELQIGGRKLDGEATSLARKWDMEPRDVEYWFKRVNFTPGKEPRTRQMWEDRGC